MVIFRRFFHGAFYLGLYALYLYMVFFSADISDIGNLPHTLARVAVAGVELGGFYLVSLYFLRRRRLTNGLGWWILLLLVSAIACMVYLVQCYSLYISNNFISALAMQNLDSSRLTTTVQEWAALTLGMCWVGMLGVSTWRGGSALASVGAWLNGRRFVAMLAVMVLLNAYLFTQQRRRIMLEPDFRQTPFASFVVNAFVAGFGGNMLWLDKGKSGGGECFTFPVAGSVHGYPFEKDSIYTGPLPFGSESGAVTHPNVIVFFTEGTSARLIGTYGGRYAGLTPNIDRLASRSMKVVDYFNHTAATYRGIIGQTSSGYSFEGGTGSDSWAKGEGALATIRRQTMATILNEKGYGTYFFEPEHGGHSFDDMIKSLGFEHVYTYDKLSELLHGHVTIQDQTDQLDDASLFRGLTQFLRQHANENGDKPFFIATYNIGTHAFIPMVKGGVRYGNGDSEVLNKLHNYDAAIGSFLDYFYASPYAKNTILVFTSDHATYPEKPYRDVAGKGLKPFFVGRIPLLIDDPTHHLPHILDADGRGSLDMAPTVLELLGIDNVSNSFLGRSLFDKRSFPVGITALGNDFYFTTPNGVYASWQVPPKLKKIASCERTTVESFYKLEHDNRIFTSGIVPQGKSGLLVHQVAAASMDSAASK